MASEEALMRAYVAGSREAFSRLFARLAPAVHAFFVRSLRNRALADDLLQTTFLKVHDARHRWTPERRVRPWIFTIAAHVREDELRRSRKVVPGLDEEQLEAEGEGAVGADVSLQEEGRAARVREALDRLPESQRVVIHLHRYEEMSFAEIAEVLGTTEGAVKLRAYRGYEHLRAALADLVKEDA
jgi:RNA polymerase sigma-70 factor (ECF subfamily)